MRALKSNRDRRTRSRSKRPVSFNDGRGRPLDYHGLLEMLRDHLDRGHPDSQEAADDLLTVAKKLSEIDVPPTSRMRVIDRLMTLDASRSILCWPDVEQELHSILTKLITRLKHAHPRRPKVPVLRNTTELPPLKRPAAHLVILNDFRNYTRPTLTDAYSHARAGALLSALEHSHVPTDDLVTVIDELRRLINRQPEHNHTLQRIIARLELEHNEHVR